MLERVDHILQLWARILLENPAQHPPFSEEPVREVLAPASEQDLDLPNSADIQGASAAVANECREEELEFSSEQVKVMVDTAILNIMQHPACADVPDGFFEDIARDLKITLSSRAGRTYNESQATHLMELVVSKCADAMR